VDGRVSRLRSKLGGEGLDFVVFFCSMVFFALSEGLIVTSAFFEALVVICNPTAV
jgi:hypothetical protein